VGAQVLNDRPKVEGVMRWGSGPEISSDIYTMLRAEPLYPKAIRRFASNMLAAGDSDLALDGILKDAGRNVAAMCAVYLHVSGGLTLPRLKALCTAFGLTSPGRARALLFYLRYLGYVSSAPPVPKGAPAVYPVAPKLLNTWGEHQRAVLDAAAVLEPEIALLIERFESPGVFETYAVLMVEGFLTTVPHFQQNMPYFRIFMHRHAGIQIVHFLLANAADDAFPPHEPIAYSISTLAQRFGVSRSHVRRMIEAAEREGMIQRCNDGAVVWAPAGREQLDYVFATQMTRFLFIAARTMASHPDLFGPLPDASFKQAIDTRAAG
jgi:hypothetical protein